MKSRYSDATTSTILVLIGKVRSSLSVDIALKELSLSSARTEINFAACRQPPGFGINIHGRSGKGIVAELFRGIGIG